MRNIKDIWANASDDAKAKVLAPLIFIVFLALISVIMREPKRAPSQRSDAEQALYDEQEQARAEFTARERAARAWETFGAQCRAQLNLSDAIFAELRLKTEGRMPSLAMFNAVKLARDRHRQFVILTVPPELKSDTDAENLNQHVYSVVAARTAALEATLEGLDQPRYSLASDIGERIARAEQRDAEAREILKRHISTPVGVASAPGNVPPTARK